MSTGTGGTTRSFPELFSAYERNMSAATSTTAAVRTRKFCEQYNEECQSRTLLQLKTCANASCGKVELSSGEYKTCSKCHRVWYCSVVCQTYCRSQHRHHDHRHLNHHTRRHPCLANEYHNQMIASESRKRLSYLFTAGHVATFRL